MHWGFYLGSCWWILWLSLASRGPACDRKRALWLYAVYKYLTAFTSLFRISLTQWTLHYSKATFDIFHSSSQGYLLWATASPFSVKVKATGKTKSSQQLRTVCLLEFSAWRLHWYACVYIGQENTSVCVNIPVYAESQGWECMCVSTCVGVCAHTCG